MKIIKSFNEWHSHGKNVETNPTGNKVKAVISEITDISCVQWRIFAFDFCLLYFFTSSFWFFFCFFFFQLKKCEWIFSLLLNQLIIAKRIILTQSLCFLWKIALIIQFNLNSIWFIFCFRLYDNAGIKQINNFNIARCVVQEFLKIVTHSKCRMSLTIYCANFFRAGN